MSSDLLAEFDSFYRAPQAQTNSASASNDLSLLRNTSQNTQPGYSSTAGTSQWQSHTNPPEDIWGGMTSLQPNNTSQSKAVAQNDIWGSFEAPPSNQTSQAFSQIQDCSGVAPAANSTNNKPGNKPGQNKPGILRRPTIDLFSKSVYDDVPANSITESRNIPPPKPGPTRKSSSGGEILFDADEIEDDDDFGDFESVAPPEQPQQLPQPPQSLSGLFGATSLEPKPPKRPADLLSTSTNFTSGTLPYPKAPKSPSFQERNPFAELGLATNQVSMVKSDDKPQTASPVTAWPAFESKPKYDTYQDSPVPNNELDEDWGDFADLPQETPGIATVKATSGIETDAWAWDAADRVAESSPPVATAPPPTNIPPPSVLLALFPPVFDLPQSTLFKEVSSKPFSLKNRIITDPSTVQFLRAYLLIATVAARIIAGRKLRWKRDNMLSQAMKIGPAAAGGKGGMKLTGVDKAEITREDREVADVVRTWKDQLGRLRSAIAVANSSIREASAHLVIPEIHETMPVKTQDGGLTAPKQCIICGLKREERVSKVDFEVEDSFGEWWVEHWGHRACRNFWQEHESKLKHR